ncbi:glycosyltransferase family 4 protein [Nocardioides bruguierae]|uniref:Glycosyltransferase family 4 protein n=1 Tax=Nocardioides bruguierae TaxID=2945102 RepID=A0A9X2D4H5_9ACTN|nr:glycosyltransferase family 4 protein [Nocardioides bruguierae]MCM0618905.1 glycosyltransferase family 4 protein [Nocardioides bruguierae]
MRVLLLAQFYPPVIGGEERHVRNLATALAARGHDVHVATLGTDRGAPQEDDGVTVHVLEHTGSRVPALYPTADRPLALPVPDPFTVRGLARLAREVRPDVAHSHNWIINSWLAVPAAHRIPLVHSLHDYSHVCATKRLVYEGEVCPGPSPRRCLSCAPGHYGQGRGQAIYAMVRAGLPVRRRSVDLFTPVSTFVGEANRLSEQGVDWEVVPNFVPDDLAADAPVDRDPALPGGDYLFFAGDLSEQKGVHTLLEAWRRLPGTVGADKPSLVMVGRPDADLGTLPPGVLVDHGWTHDRVVSGFRHARAAVLPSEWPDPCPTTVLEAMALRAPLVTTRQGGIADMVTHEESALVVRTGDAAGLTDAIRRLLDEPALGARLAEAAEREVVRYRQGSVADRFSQIYADVVAARS